MSSVRTELSPATLANQAVLERRQNNRTIVLVEGGSDARYLRPFIDKAAAALTICHDREKLVLTLGILRSRGIAGVVGLADKDYDHLVDEDCTIYDSDIIVWDQNDLESTILPGVIDKIVNEFGSEDKINAALNDNECNIIGLIVEQAAKIGSLRALNKITRNNFNFKGMTYQFSQAASFEIDLNETVNHVLSRSDNSMDIAEIKKRCDSILAETDEKLSICQGHDLIRILGRAIRRQLGSDSQFDKNNRLKNQLYSIVRVAHGEALFRSLDFSRNLVAWEQQNIPWVVLKSSSEEARASEL